MSHRCPRRDETFGRYRDEEGAPDEYRNGGGLANGFAPTCSYCGSVSGDDFMSYVRAGGTVEGTDKNYKAYLSKDTGTPSEMVKYNAFQRSDGSWATGSKVKEGTGVMHAKFYFQHLSEDQQREFVDLLNERKVTHTFYRWPFFVRFSS